MSEKGKESTRLFWYDIDDGEYILVDHEEDIVLHDPFMVAKAKPEEDRQATLMKQGASVEAFAERAVAKELGAWLDYDVVGRTVDVNFYGRNKDDHRVTIEVDVEYTLKCAGRMIVPKIGAFE